MINLIVLAHAGEEHQDVAQSTSHLLSDPTFLWLILLLAPFLILFICLNVLRLRLNTSLLILSGFLIVYSVLTYKAPGAYTMVAMSVGFVIIFLTTFLSLGVSAKSKPKKR